MTQSIDKDPAILTRGHSRCSRLDFCSSLASDIAQSSSEKCLIMSPWFSSFSGGGGGGGSGGISGLISFTNNPSVLAILVSAVR